RRRWGTRWGRRPSRGMRRGYGGGHQQQSQEQSQSETVVQEAPIIKPTDYATRAADSAGDFAASVIPLMVRIGFTDSHASIFISTKETYENLCADLQRMFQLPKSMKALKSVWKAEDSWFSKGTVLEPANLEYLDTHGKTELH
ncbi:MAG: hypothetical protein M1830_000823, partial [Pleopsidium flavum]